MKTKYAYLFVIFALLLIPAVAPAIAVTNTVTDLKADKATYAAGQKVTITGKLLQDSTALANVYVSVEVRSPTKTVWLDSVMTDSSGVFTSSFTLAANAESGSYTIYTTYTGVQKTASFNVGAAAATYSITNFKADKAIYATGEKVTISGTLLLGTAAVADAYVSVEVRSPTKTVWLDSVKTSSSGVFTSSFTLASDAESGAYTIYVTYSDLKPTTTFSITTDIVEPTIGSATLDKASYTSGASIKVTVQAIDNIGVVSASAGTVSLTRTAGTALSGTWTGTVTAATAAGANSIVITAYDASGNKATKTLTYTVDSTAPTITITSPADGATVYEASVLIRGTVTDNVGVASLTVAGVSAAVLSDGSFSRTATLVEGSNVIAVIASDTAGNTATKTVTVILEKGVLQVQIALPNLAFRGDTVEIYVQSGIAGQATDLSGTPTGKIYSAGLATPVDLTFSKVAVGLYLAKWTIPSTAATGTYAVQATGTVFGYTSIEVAAFQINPTLTDEHNAISDISKIGSDVKTLSTTVSSISGGVAQAATFSLVVTVLALIVIVLEIVILVRRR